MTPAYGENEPQALVFEGRSITALSASGHERHLAALAAKARAA
jgi:hypothetical protein